MFHVFKITNDLHIHVFRLNSVLPFLLLHFKATMLFFLNRCHLGSLVHSDVSDKYEKMKHILHFEEHLGYCYNLILDIANPNLNDTGFSY